MLDAAVLVVYQGTEYHPDQFQSRSPRMAHTILLVQPGIKPETRTYSDYESVGAAGRGGRVRLN